MWNRLISWWEVRTRGKDLRGPLPIQKDVLKDRHSSAEIQVMSILALLLFLPLVGLAYYWYSGPQRAEKELADGIRLTTPGHYDEAAMMLTKALGTLSDSHPNRYMAFLMRATANRYLGNKDRAREDYAKAIELRPDCARCYSERASLLRELKEYSLALEDLDRAQASGKTAEDYAERASIYEETNEMKKAIEEVTKAIALREQWPQLYRVRARLRKAIGDQAGFDEDKAFVIKLDGRW